MSPTNPDATNSASSHRPPGCQDSRDFGDAETLVAPVVKSHGAEHEVKGSVGEGEVLGHRLLKPDLAGGGWGLRPPPHLARRRAGAQPGRGKPPLAPPTTPPASPA